MTRMQVSRALREACQCPVAEPGHSNYVTALTLDNGRIRHEPLAVVLPQTWAHVAAAVRFAAAEGVPISVRGGGHGAAGYCLNTSGIVVDMRRIDEVVMQQDGRALRVGGGARWRQVYECLARSGTGRVAIGGACPDVGVGGFLLGGGLSFLSRSYGLGSDSVTGLIMATASGAIQQVNACDAPDLFWACRGGGGGNFGIVLEWQMQTHMPRSRTMLGGEVIFPFARTREVLAFYNEWAATLPASMAVYGYLGPLSAPLSGGELKGLRLTPVFNGPFEEGRELLKPLLDERPIHVRLHEMTFPEWADVVGDATLVNGRGAYIRSAMLPPNGMTREVAGIFTDFMLDCPSAGSFLVWTHIGGAISDLDGTATAFPHREAAFVPEIKAIWDATQPSDMRVNVEWAFDFFEALSHASIGAYLNYIDPLLSDWQHHYYGQNYSRLLTAKQAWDPQNVFAFPQGIGSTFVPDLTRPLDLTPLGVP